MSSLRRTCRLVWSLLAITAFVFLPGCGTPDPAPVTRSQTGSAVTHPSDVLHVGDIVSINFSGPSELPTPKHEERIKGDGNINLPFIGAVQAAGLTRAQLEECIQTNYVPRFYKHLNVTVGSESRFFYVEGQVRNPGRYSFAGEMDVLKCVAAAGDFTDFAKRTQVEVIRSNGKKEKVNCLDAQRNPDKNIPIYPDDRIYVPRRYF